MRGTVSPQTNLTSSLRKVYDYKSVIDRLALHRILILNEYSV